MIHDFLGCGFRFIGDHSQLHAFFHKLIKKCQRTGEIVSFLGAMLRIIGQIEVQHLLILFFCRCLWKRGSDGIFNAMTDALTVTYNWMLLKAETAQGCVKPCADVG